MEEKNALDQELEQLFQRYRNACPDVEASPLFLPQLWEKIEARQSSTFVWKRLTQGFVTFAAAVSVLFALLIFLPRQRGVPEYGSYVETLAETQLAGMSVEPGSAPVYVPPREVGGQ